MMKIYTNRKPPEKPRTFKETFGHYCRVIDRKKKWTCPDCQGWGKLYDPVDNDPIEGYKMAHPKLPCLRCRATGYVTEASLRKKYKKIIEEYKQKVLNHKKFLELLFSAENKLTNEEINAINEKISYWG